MTTQEKYLSWKNHPNLDEELRNELLTLDEKQIEDAFYTDVKFGTAGMRGVMGVGSNRINIHTIRKATQGFANWLTERHLDKVAIGYDNRYHSRDFAIDCARLLAKNNIQTYLFDSLRPTPELSFAVRYYHCVGGIMITASHNPKEYNGYKLYDETGCQLIPEIADEVTAEVNKIEDVLSLTCEPYDASLIHIINTEVDEAYYKEVLDIRYRKDLDKDFRIAFSPQHGASYLPVMTILKRAGYNVHEVQSQKDPDPAFSHTASPNPEERASYEAVLELSKQIDAELLLICDPDGDRMGVGVRHQGEYVILNGNQTGALLLEYVLRAQDELNCRMDNACMFNTIVTSDIGERVAEYHHVQCEKTLTGFKFIGSKVRQYETTKEKNYVFGYEESYGSLIRPFVRDKDATQACLMLSEACAFYRSMGMTLQDALEDIYQKVGAYYDSQLSIMLPGADGALKLKEIMQTLREKGLTIPGYTIVKTEDYLLQKSVKDGKEEAFTSFGISDVLKYYLSDGSFVAIRPSGTEPKCKIYLSTKAETFLEAKKKDSELRELLSGIIR